MVIDDYLRAYYSTYFTYVRSSFRVFSQASTYPFPSLFFDRSRRRFPPLPSSPPIPARPQPLSQHHYFLLWQRCGLVAYCFMTKPATLIRTLVALMPLRMFFFVDVAWDGRSRRIKAAAGFPCCSGCGGKLVVDWVLSS